MDSTSHHVFAFLVKSLLHPPVQAQKADREQPEKVQLDFFGYPKVQLLNKPIELDNAVRV